MESAALTAEVCVCVCVMVLYVLAAAQHMVLVCVCLLTAEKHTLILKEIIKNGTNPPTTTCNPGTARPRCSDSTFSSFTETFLSYFIYLNIFFSQEHVYNL